jgi:hypothetical protein
VTLAAHGDRLRFSPRSAVTPELLAGLQAHKLELLRLLAWIPIGRIRLKVFCEFLRFRPGFSRTGVGQFLTYGVC